MDDGTYRSIIAISEEANGEKTSKILYMSAYFSYAISIHLDMFLCIFSDIKEELDAAIQLLQKEYLIELNNNQAFFIKKDIQRKIRAYLEHNGMVRDILTEALDLQIFHIFNICISSDVIHQNCIDHALSLLSYIREFDELFEISLGLPNLLVIALRKHNRLDEAYAFGKKALELIINTVGECHAATLSLQHSLATVMDSRGQYAKAAKVLLDLTSKDLKYSNPQAVKETLIAYARELSELSKYRDALPIYEVLLRGKNVLDTFDSETLTAWHDYAILLHEMGRHSDAIDILQDVFSQKKKGLVPDDQFGLQTQRCMATVFQAQGHYSQAMKHLKEVFYECKKHLGEYHKDTLRSERDIGTLLLHKGDHKEALRKLKNVEKKFEQIFSDSNPDILCTRANIVGALMSLKKYNEALQISEGLYEAYKNVFGEKQNETLRVKYNIGKIFYHQRKLEEGIKTFQEVYMGFHDVFGPEHEQTVHLKAELEPLRCLLMTLHTAAQTGDLYKIISYIENGEDVNKADVEQKRPLHYAASNGRISAAKYLLKMGAMYNAEDFTGATPCQIASGEEMKNLLNSVANLFKDVKEGIQANIAIHRELINVKDKNGYSLLHWAVYNSRKHVVQQLLDVGADPKCISLKGNTPLHVASSKGLKEIAEILLQFVTGNDLRHLVNYKTTVGGNTALHVAARNNDLNLVKCLLMHGAIYDIKNNEGLIPVQLSTVQSILNLLKVIEVVFSSVREGNSGAIAQLKLLSSEELSAVTKARNGQNHTLLQVAIMNRHESINELLQLLKDPQNSK